MNKSKPVLLLLRLIKSYANAVSVFIDKTVGPVAEFLENYSTPMAESIRNISSAIRNIVMLLPLVMLSMIVGLVFGQGSSVNLNSLWSLELQSILVSILAIGSVCSLLISHYILKDKIINTIYVSSLPAVAALLISHFNPPELYVVLLAVLYGFGGYTATQVSLQNPIPHDYVYDELQPHSYIVRISILSTAVLIIPIIGLHVYQSGTIYLTISLIAGFISHITTVLQNPKYETYYTKIEPNVDSMIWILTPRLLLILGLGGLILSEPSYIYMILLFAPALFGFGFYHYINSKASKLFGDRFMQDVQGRYKPFLVSTNSNIDINESEVGDEEVELDVRINFSIDDKVPDDGKTKWVEATEITHGIYKSIESVRRVSESDKRKIEEFYDDLVGRIVEKEDSVNLEKLPKGLRHRFISQMANQGNINNQDIMDNELTTSDVKRKDSKLYSDDI